MKYLTESRFKLFFTSGDMITVDSREDAIQEIGVRSNMLQDFATQVIEYREGESITYKPEYLVQLNWIEYTQKGKTYSL